MAGTYSSQSVVGITHPLNDPAGVEAASIQQTGSGMTGGEYAVMIPAGSRTMVVTEVSYTVSVINGTTDQVIKFWRQPAFGQDTTPAMRAITFNSGDGTGATSMTIPVSPTQVVGDVFRVFFGQDADEDHIIRPGEGFAIEIDTAGGDACQGVFNVYGFYMDVGTQVDILGGATTTAIAKPGSNTSGSIYNVIA